MKTIESKNKHVILDKDSRKQLIYTTIIGVALYLCALSIVGIN